jgi:hypothetical protein
MAEEKKSQNLTVGRLHTCIFLIAMLVVFLSNPSRAQDHHPTDKFNLDTFKIGLDYTKFCDLRDGAPISDACFAFIGAVVEIVESNNLSVPEDKRYFPATCIPHGLKIKEIFETIRPRLRADTGVCLGMCTSTSYVISSLAALYPCKK